jgi:RimJ/RimL family protein N-acetyltransferase
MLETQRLLLRPFEPGDLDAFVELHSDPEVTRFVNSLDRAEAEDRLDRDRREWSQRGYGLLAVIDLQSGAFLGRSGLKHWPQFEETEVGWVLRKDAWGVGYATEAARASIEWAFSEFELPYLTAMIDAGNTRSVRVAKRLGFTPLRDDVLLGDPVVVHSLRKTA